MGHIATSTGATAPAQRQSYEDFIPLRTDDPALREAIGVLDNPHAIKLIDTLEAEKKTDAPNNGAFGIDGLYALSKLTTSSPKWQNTPGAATTTPAERTAFIHAAQEALQHSKTLNAIAGSDQRINAADLQKWLNQSTEIKFQQHIIHLADPGAQRLMAQFAQTPKAGTQAEGVISKQSIAKLASLKPDSSAWQTLPESLRPDVAKRAEIIHAASKTLQPENAKLLASLLGKDQTITAQELNNWSKTFRQNDANGMIDPFEQGQVGNCFIVGSIVAVQNTPEGRNAIADSITHNSDNTHTVTFKGDPATPITVTESDLKKTPHSAGDKDAALIEVALEKYAATGKMTGNKIPNTTSEGGQPSVVMQLLTGKDFSVSNDLTGDQLLDQLGQPNLNAVFMTNHQFRPGREIDHTFGVVGVDRNARTVTLINPWDSGTPFTKSAEELAKLDHQVIRLT